MAVGMAGYFAVGVESSGGTDSFSVAVCDYVGILSENLVVNKTDLNQANLQQQFDEVETYQGMQSVAGNVSMEVHPRAVGYFLRSAFDSTSTCQTSAGAAWANTIGFSHASWRVHQFIAKQSVFQAGSGSDLPTLTCVAFRGPGTAQGSAFAYYNCAANAMELSVDAGGLLRASFDLVGRNYSRLARATPSFLTAKAFVWAQASVSVAGTGKPHFESLTIRMNNALEPFPRLDGSYYNSVLKRTGYRTVEVNGSLTFSDDTDYDNFIAGSESALRVTYILTTSETLDIQVPAFRYTTFAPALSGPGRVQVGFTGRGMWHAGSGTPLQVLIFNDRVSPYTSNSLG